jgi:hypothetical protein
MVLLVAPAKVLGITTSLFARFAGRDGSILASPLQANPD